MGTLLYSIALCSDLVCFRLLCSPLPDVKVPSVPHVLEQQFGALPLGGEAGDSPHLDLDAGVELLVPHVPHPLDRSGYGFILTETKHRRVKLKAKWLLLASRGMYLHKDSCT